MPKKWVFLPLSLKVTLRELSILKSSDEISFACFGHLIEVANVIVESFVVFIVSRVKR